MKYKRTATQVVGETSQQNVLEIEGEVNEIADLLSFLDFIHNPDNIEEDVKEEPTKH